MSTPSPFALRSPVRVPCAARLIRISSLGTRMPLFGSRLLHLLSVKFLDSFVAERVNRKEPVLESLNASLEETLYFVIQIEKSDTYKLRHFFSDSRFSDTANACQKYAHLYTLSEIFFWSERFTSLAAKSIARNERRFFLAE